MKTIIQRASSVLAFVTLLGLPACDDKGADEAKPEASASEPGASAAAPSATVEAKTPDKPAWLSATKPDSGTGFPVPDGFEKSYKRGQGMDYTYPKGSPDLEPAIDYLLAKEGWDVETKKEVKPQTYFWRAKRGDEGIYIESSHFMKISTMRVRPD